MAGDPHAVGADERSALLAPTNRLPDVDESYDSLDSSTTVQTLRLWEEFCILLKFTLPILGTQLLEYSLVIVDVISVGHLSTNSLAASTLGSMTASVTGYSIVQGFASTLDTVLPAAWTGPQPSLVGLWTQRSAVVMAFVLLPIFAVWANAEPLLLRLGQDPEIAHLAGVYLRWAMLGLPADAFATIARKYYQSQGLSHVPTNILLVVAPLNALMSYLLVWGPEPIRLGFIGAPIATAISFNLIALAALLYGMFFAPRKAWHPISARCFTSLGFVIRLGIAGVGQIASEWWSWEFFTLAASMLGPTALATQSVLVVSSTTMFQATFSLSIATAIRVGHLLGEKNADRARVASRAALLVALLFSSITTTILLSGRNFWGRLFTTDPLVIVAVAKILPIVGLFQVVDGQSIVVAGILRACGRQAIGAYLNLSTYYIFGIPLGIFLAFKQHMGLPGLWIGLSVALVYCAGVGLLIYSRTNWDAEVRKVEERMKEEHKHGIGAGDVEAIN